MRPLGPNHSGSRIVSESIEVGDETVLSIVKEPYLQWPTLDSMTIMWETSSEASAKVTFFETEKVHSGLNGKFKTIRESKRAVEDRHLCKIHSMVLADGGWKYLSLGFWTKAE